MTRLLKLGWLMLVTILISNGCTPTTILATPAPSKSPGTSAPATLTLAPGVTPTLIPFTYEFLRNTRYFVPGSNTTVKLVDGSYQDGSGANYLSVKMADTYAIGDLNQDNINDAAVILAENTGGSGVYMTLVVMLYQGGLPAQIAMEIGDREQVKSVTIKDQRVTLDMVVHLPNDAACCPTQPKVETYVMTPNGLVLVHSTTKTQAGVERSITIANPTSGSAVTDSVQVKGSVTVAPSENTLAYHLSDASGNLIAEGSLKVTAAEAGGQGTFDSAIDLSKVTSGTPIRLAILDLSAADGSVQAMDSVVLTRQ